MRSIFNTKGLLAAWIGLSTTAQLWPGVSAQWTMRNIVLDSVSCDTAATNYLAKAIYNIQSMLYSTISGLSTIKDNLGKAREDLEAADRAKLDLFMAMYGIFDPVDTDAISTAQTTVDTVATFANQLLGGLENDALEIGVCCNNDHLREIKGVYPVLYESNVYNDMLPIPAEDNCDGNLRAMMQETATFTRDIMTICPDSLPMTNPDAEYEEAWIAHIDQYDTGSLTGIQGEYMDDIVATTGEVTLLHELTHTESFFGASGVLEDMFTSEEENAYRWEKCFDLADNPETRANAVKNAETFAYFSAGLYLDQCNWRDGECENPEDVD
ncbi:hypothetical protein DTO063F5_7076 [Paecilomyces variotii]|nr:hypothetical protein DTO063F5_7076 [Paecilomyces variotii]